MYFIILKITISINLYYIIHKCVCKYLHLLKCFIILYDNNLKITLIYKNLP